MAIDPSQIEHLFGSRVDVGLKVDVPEITRAIEPKEKFAVRVLADAKKLVFEKLFPKGDKDFAATVRRPENYAEKEARTDLNQFVLSEQTRYENDFKEKHGVDMRSVPGADDESKFFNTNHSVPPEDVAEAHAANNLFKRMRDLAGAVDWTTGEGYSVNWFLDRAAGERRLQLYQLSIRATSKDIAARESMQKLSDEIAKIDSLKQRLGCAPVETDMTALAERQVRAASLPLRESLTT